jgi:predicted acetyltransferase
MPADRKIVLTPMAPGRDAEFEEMLAEFRAAGETDAYRGHHDMAWKGYAAFYDLMLRMKSGGYPTPDIVPMDSYFIEENGRILGEVYIRHRLSPRLEKIGGHIGYKVRPTERNQGIATAALKLGLQLLRQACMERALVTCGDTNAASARVIEKCGGVRIDNAETERGIERRYWVPTASG